MYERTFDHLIRFLKFLDLVRPTSQKIDANLKSLKLRWLPINEADKLMTSEENSKYFHHHRQKKEKERGNCSVFHSRRLYFS